MNIITFNSLSANVRNIIQNLLVESSRFNANDVLVDVQSGIGNLFEMSDQFTISVSNFPPKILRDAKQTYKESGINPLCLAEMLVELKLNGKLIHTPVFLSPAEYRVNKIEQSIRFDILSDAKFVNPFLLFHLENQLELKEAREIAEQIDEFPQYLNNLGLRLTEKKLLGNFHHHRYQVIRELEELSSTAEYNAAMCSLFGDPHEKNDLVLELRPDTIYSSDTDHELVFQRVKTCDTVIQGPPGTGKSQVLTNLMAKSLAGGLNSIVVSEKRVALEVIKKKLGSYGLDQLCFIATSDNLSSSLIKELRSTWDFFETTDIKAVRNLRLSEQYSASLQMTLDLLLQKNLIGGVSFSEFKSLCMGMDFSGLEYYSNVMEIDHFLENEKTIKQCYSLGLHPILAHLKKAALSKETIASLDQKIESWLISLEVLKRSLPCEIWQDLDKAMRIAVDCQIFENDIYKQYHSIFKPGSSAQKQFIRLRKDWLKQNELAKQFNHSSHWKKEPSLIETRMLLDDFRKNKSIITHLRDKKRWRSYSTIPFPNAIEVLDEHSQKLTNNLSLSQIKVKFCDLGIEDVENEVPLIYHTLHVLSEDRWKELEALTPAERNAITDLHQLLLSLKEDLQRYFNFNANTSVTGYLQLVKGKLDKLIPVAGELCQLNAEDLQSIGMSEDFEKFRARLLHSHQINFNRRFPNFSAFEIRSIKDKVSDVIVSEEHEFKLFAQEILRLSAMRFKEYNELLSTPARKLTSEQKVLKTRLRSGKAILVKEFAKTRSHPSLRELYNSDARLWIETLKPVWLSNPTQLAKCFPLESGLFDLAIFDEASQIRLQDALGAIYRSKRVVVAGDEHQMGPGSYFSSGGANAVDLLHQAAYHWQKVPLMHHYRSANPELIAFSNAHFYEGKLKAFPEFGAGKAIRRHYIESGRFVDRKNLEEARSVAQLIQQYVNASENIGIVAFSEEQLLCIWNELDANVQDKLSEMIDNDQAFFKALENVQGDECDRLIVSFGHGRNENGEFHMRFGPMNTENGRKRLNVLLTRAIHSIDFFCSVTSQDFKLSDNESIELLRQWFRFMEGNTRKEDLVFPYDLKPEIDDSNLTLRSIQKNISSAKELVTLQNVLENRGWKVNYA